MGWEEVVAFLIAFGAAYYALCHGIKTKSAV